MRFKSRDPQKLVSSNRDSQVACEAVDQAVQRSATPRTLVVIFNRLLPTLTVVVNLYRRDRRQGQLLKSPQDVAVITHVYDGYCISGAAGDGRYPVEITKEVGAGQSGEAAVFEPLCVDKSRTRLNCH